MPAPLFMAGAVGLQTELFQLVQAAVYHADGLWGEATFDLYLKDLPQDWGFAVVAGVGPAIEGVLATRFTEEEIAWLRQRPSLSRISDYFFETLTDFVFTGDIDAMPEGTAVFPGQPILRITAPLQQAGLIQSRLIQTIGYATAVATRAARMSLAAQGRPVMDFGSRRTSGAEAAWSAARAAWIGGCTATTSALAAHTLHIPEISVISGSMFSAYTDPASAYAVLGIHGSGALYLDAPPLADLPRLVPIKGELRSLRLDAPDLSAASRQLRGALDALDMGSLSILGSGSLDEHAIAALRAEDAPIEMFGVGSALTAAQPLHISYRIAQLYRGPTPEPATGRWAAPWPGRKQVVRTPERDVICLAREAGGLAGEPLLMPVIRQGHRISDEDPLPAMRARCQRQLPRLPEELLLLRSPGRRAVVFSEGLQAILPK
ncbi:MAG: nicotinate phosphoribosyltransferase [Myxococcota bacterium]|jgi:nicotinate phosphoribosyltransferase